MRIDFFHVQNKITKDKTGITDIRYSFFECQTFFSSIASQDMLDDQTLDLLFWVFNIPKICYWDA